MCSVLCHCAARERSCVAHEWHVYLILPSTGKGIIYKVPGKGYVKKVPKKTLTPGAPSTLPPVSPPVIPPTLGPGETAQPTPECTTCRSGCLAITDFVIVDANDAANSANPESQYLVYLQEGATYSLSQWQTAFPQVQEFALVCITDPPPFRDINFAIGSVGLRDNVYGLHVGTAGANNGLDYNGEGSPPYSLQDDNNGIYTPTDFSIGEDWSITCQAFCGSGLTGESSVAVTRTFQIVA